MYKIISGTYTLSLTAENFLTNTKKIYLQCRTSLGAVNVILPKISTAGGTWGFEIYIDDKDNNASTHNITITPNGTDKINGVNAAVVINTNGGNGTFEIIDTDKWQFALASSGGSSSTVGEDSGTITISADGSTGTINGNESIPVSLGGGDFRMTIPTTARVLLVHLNSLGDSINNLIFSYGKSDGTIQDCIWNSIYILLSGTAYIMGSDQSNCIRIDAGAGSGNSGWNGIIGNITDSSFDITFSLQGEGLNTAITWNAITG